MLSFFKHQKVSLEVFLPRQSASDLVRDGNGLERHQAMQTVFIPCWSAGHRCLLVFWHGEQDSDTGTPAWLVPGGGPSPWFLEGGLLPLPAPSRGGVSRAVIWTRPVILWQFGNTCYCNSVLQALYFCRPFRENVLAYKAQQKKKENLLTCLADLFHSIATQKKKVGVIPPKKFISRLRKENGE